MLVTAAEKLEQEAYEQNVPVDYVKFKSDRLHGLYIDGSIAIRSGLSSAQTADTLAEELEHHYTSYGNILDLPAESRNISPVSAPMTAGSDFPELSADTGIIAITCMNCQNVWKCQKNFCKKL